jgi:hypothetical protein
MKKIAFHIVFLCVLLIAGSVYAGTEGFVCDNGDTLKKSGDFYQYGPYKDFKCTFSKDDSRVVLCKREMAVEPNDVAELRTKILRHEEIFVDTIGITRSKIIEEFVLDILTVKDLESLTTRVTPPARPLSQCREI